MGKDKQITVREVIKSNCSKNEVNFFRILFGCGEIELHVGFPEGKMTCFASGLSKEVCEQVLNAKVYNYEFKQGRDMKITLENGNTEGVQI